jgi:hypothetical protein
MTFRGPSAGQKTVSHDFQITYHGTVSTLDVLTEPAREWVENNVEAEPWQWFGERRLAIDPRSMETISTALLEAGFSEAEGQ